MELSIARMIGKPEYLFALCVVIFTVREAIALAKTVAAKSKKDDVNLAVLGRLEKIGIDIDTLKRDHCDVRRDLHEMRESAKECHDDIRMSCNRIASIEGRLSQIGKD